jgi:hypothetical protein
MRLKSKEDVVSSGAGHPVEHHSTMAAGEVHTAFLARNAKQEEVASTLAHSSTTRNTDAESRQYIKGNWKREKGESILYASPHTYRDTLRLKPSYEVIPAWLWTSHEFLDDAASAIVLTYPPDVEAVRTKLLPVLGFREPYHVLPVYQTYGTDTPEREVMVIARRPEPASISDFLPLVKGEILHPSEVARRLQPLAKSVLHIFDPDNRLLFDPPPYHPETELFGRPPLPNGGRVRRARSPQCWKAWDE